MSDRQSVGDNYFRNAPEGGNPNIFPAYGSSPEIHHMHESGLGDNQKEPDRGGGLGASKGRIWGMERRTFIIVLGVFIILIIALAAGVGWGVSASVAKGKDSRIVSLVSGSTQSSPQDSSAPTGSTPLSTFDGGRTTVVTLTSSPVTVTSSINGGRTTIVTVSSSRVTVVSSIPPPSASNPSSSAPTPIRKNSPFAAVGWNKNIVLFYKDEDGSIRYRENDGLKWGGSLQITNLKPRDDSGFAAVGWNYDNMEQIRMYTVSGSGGLSESVWNSSVKSWYTQDISKGLDPVIAGGYLTAYTWGIDSGGLRIRIYYQGQDGYIREAAFDNGKGWGKGVNPTQGFPQAKSRTGLAIVPFPDTNDQEAKLFYQSMGDKLVSFDYKRGSTSEGSWQSQDSTVDHGPAPDGTQFAAILNKASDTVVRVYLVREGKMAEVWWSKSSLKWSSWWMHDAVALGVTANPYSGDVQVFYQDKTGYISTAVLVQTSPWSFPGPI